MAIQLLSEQHEPIMTWQLRNAWPVALQAPRLQSSTGNVAIESLEVAHEGIKVSNG